MVRNGQGKGAKAMDASHFLVGGLTAISLSLLIWIEVRCRRQVAEKVKELRSEINDRPAASTSKDEL